MEVMAGQIAERTGHSTRAVQQALAAGRLRGHRRVGRTVVIDDLAVTAWQRSTARGRVWTPEVREAALDLLSHGSPDKLNGSELSRLRSRLRQMDARQLSHAAGGLDAWARYRGTADSAMERVGPSAVDSATLGLVPGENWLTFIQVPDLGVFELQHEVVLDPDGNLGVLQRDAVDNRSARILLDTYLLGDARQSHAAATELERRARDA